MVVGRRRVLDHSADHLFHPAQSKGRHYMQQLHRQFSQCAGSVHSCVLRSNLAGFPTTTEFSETSCLITDPIPIRQPFPIFTPPMTELLVPRYRHSGLLLESYAACLSSMSLSSQ